MNEATLSTNAFTKPRLRAGQIDEVHRGECRRTFGHLVDEGCPLGWARWADGA
jgi:hypothetical protein